MSVYSMCIQCPGSQHLAAVNLGMVVNLSELQVPQKMIKKKYSHRRVLRELDWESELKLLSGSSEYSSDKHGCKYVYWGM